MEFSKGIPEFDSIADVKNYSLFLEHGQPELNSFLVRFFGLDRVCFQTGKLNIIKEWLKVEELEQIMPVKGEDESKICLLSQIVIQDKVVAYYPYVLEGRTVSSLVRSEGLLKRITEIISEQVTICYLRGFKGGDWLFGDIFAQRLIANCITRNGYKGRDFAHLVEKMGQLSVTTFEGEYFTTGIIVSQKALHYKKNKLRYNKPRHIDQLDKRDWFLADGNSSFLLVEPSLHANSLYIVEKKKSENYIEDFFENYYLSGTLNDNDFIIRTVGPNEISISDIYEREFVKVENVWYFRDKKNFDRFLQSELGINDKVSNAIIYYTLKCSRKHISSIIWIPQKTDAKSIEELTAENRIQIWKKKLDLLLESNEVLIDKVLASDGAMVIEKSGKVMYENVFAKMEKVKSTSGALGGTGEAATKNLAQNGVAIKISQDGTIKVFSGDKRFCY